MRTSDSVSIPCNPSECSQAEIDAALERRIHCAYLSLTLASDYVSRLDHWQRMKELIGQRSPDQIARMEAKIEGLR